MTDVTTAQGAPAPSFSARIHSLNRPNVVSVGTIIWLSSELMFFAGLFAMYFTARARAGAESGWPPEPTELNLPYALFFTIVLAGRVFGAGFGVVLGCSTLFASAIITGGVGPWLPYQMFGASWVGLLAGLLPRLRGKAEHDLGVDEVLRTTQTDETNLHR